MHNPVSKTRVWADQNGEDQHQLPDKILFFHTPVSPLPIPPAPRLWNIFHPVFPPVYTATTNAAVPIYTTTTTTRYPLEPQHTHYHIRLHKIINVSMPALLQFPPPTNTQREWDRERGGGYRTYSNKAWVEGTGRGSDEWHQHHDNNKLLLTSTQLFKPHKTLANTHHYFVSVVTPYQYVIFL